jgi:hypothetical protein
MEFPEDGDDKELKVMPNREKQILWIPGSLALKQPLVANKGRTNPQNQGCAHPLDTPVIPSEWRSQIV